MLIHHLVALLYFDMQHFATGEWWVLGAANRRRPLHPRALANKIAAARCPRLIPYGYRVGDFDATNTGAVCN
ncbi:hypothetical protein H5I32_14790 [Escherichia coli]|uniref:hypothetical protein n=1 Tax=Escherichia coli TaxID=562 RepID=UPI00192CC203|nr:hypothetical protein [Escherichia coli]MBL4089899.1 hypothetical protein [Escherichia coli]